MLIESFINRKSHIFLWNYNCDYRGNDWDTQYDVRGFSQCAKSCMQNIRNCNHFSYDTKLGVCYLKKATKSQPIVETTASLCGEFPSRIRIPVSNRTWIFNQNRSVKWSNDCTFRKVTPLNITMNGINSASDCGDICKSNLNCNYFLLYQNICNLYKSIGRILGFTLLGSTCGTIPGRVYNEESLKKCNFTRVY